MNSLNKTRRKVQNERRNLKENINSIKENEKEENEKEENEKEENEKEENEKKMAELR